MVSSLGSAITVLFFKPCRMHLAVQGFEVAFKSIGKHKTEVFLYLFIGKALQANSDLLQVFDRLIMEDIYQNKTEKSEHDLLIIHTHDNLDGMKRKFILEHRVAAEWTNTENTTHCDHIIDKEIDETDRTNKTTPIPLTTKIYDTTKKFIDTIVWSSESESNMAASQEAMKEGLLPSFSPFFSPSPSQAPSIASESFLITDSITVSVSETADSVSDTVVDSLDQEQPQALVAPVGYLPKLEHSL